MANYALIKNGIVDNVILWDGLAGYTPDGTPVDITSVTPVPNKGWTYDGTIFTNPNPPVVVTPPTPPSDWLTPFGWSMSIDVVSQNRFTNMGTIYSVAKSYLPDADWVALLASNTTIRDTAQQDHTLTVNQTLQLLLGYGQYCQVLWDAGTLPS